MARSRATMDFFAHQDAARRNTFLLTLYFILAVFFIVCGVYLAVVAAWNLAMEGGGGLLLWNSTLFGQIAAGVCALILIGSLYKIIVLSKGGEKVAEMLGAVQIAPDTTDPEDRKLLNVVEEMAIASGVPVPRVYALRREKGINAFAAGFSTGDAVIAVTQGCLSHLSRDELQGVVAHEFSHIFNGDMRLNIRLMGIINGILVIALIGRIILRSMSSSRSSGSRSKKGGGGLPVVVLGLALLAVGYIGVFFGKLIKSAVSRQREFLADASAVQFTRNPSGISGALKKIGGFESGSRVNSVHAEDVSHLFFVNGLRDSFARLLSTHPSLEERIRRIDPLFSRLPSGSKTAGEGGGGMEESAGFQAFAPGEGGDGSEQVKVRVAPDRVLAMVGAPQQEHLEHAARLLSGLPAAVVEAAREAFGARALMYCLLLDHREAIRKRQMENLNNQTENAVTDLVRQLSPVVDTIGAGYRLALLDMALPALRGLSAEQYRGFRTALEGLVAADAEISLFEHALQYAVTRHLEPILSGRPAIHVRYHSVDPIRVELTELLSIISWQGNSLPAQAEKAFQKGLRTLGEEAGAGGILPAEKCSDLGLMKASLDRLRHASPKIKKRILSACIHCICSDEWITVQEAELIRIVADGLDCPVPLITVGSLAGKPVVTEYSP
ncbi:MAG: M48 family metallopeptidase [Thermodesulfobacteriota bacterium]